MQSQPLPKQQKEDEKQDHHNPHLELSLSTWKKISSVLEHLNRKWGDSSLLSKDLMLFPYWAQSENLLGYQKWTKDSPLCAGDIHNLIGSPQVFRLRYGWFSKAEIESATAQAMTCDNPNSNFSMAEEQNVKSKNQSGPCSGQIVSTELIPTLTPSYRCTAVNTIECGGSVSNINFAQYHDSPVIVSSFATEHEALVVKGCFDTKDMALSAGDWADSITRVSVEDLLSESSHGTDINYTLGSNSLEQIPFSCDFFDAAISAFLRKHQNNADSERIIASHGHAPSIWDADETCNAFSFQINSVVSDKKCGG